MADKIIESIKDVKPLLNELVKEVGEKQNVYAHVDIRPDNVSISIYPDIDDEESEED